MLKYFFFLNLIIISFSLPVAIFHGFFDSCSNSFFEELINRISTINGDYAACIESGGGAFDMSTSFYSQAKAACEKINLDENFNGNFSILSLSQGGLLGRYVVEKCEMKGIVRKFVSIGGPMLGTSRFPFCLGGVFCFLLNSFIGWSVYFKSIQDSIGPAGYFKTPTYYDDYITANTFLVDINNEGKNFDEKAKERFIQLEKLVLIGFRKDQMISPKESAEFSEYDKKYKLIPMNETLIYRKDLFGLKTISEQNKIKVIYLDGQHLDFSWEDIIKYGFPSLR